MDKNKFDNDQQATAAIQLAIGRIFRMGARPEQPNDIEVYENCKWIIMDAAEYLGVSSPKDYRPDYIRDYNKINHA